MSFSDILVFLDRSVHSPARLTLAADLAAAHRAGLIGLRVEVHPHVPAALRAEIPQSAIDAQAAAIAGDSARIEAAFRDEARRRALPAEWWLRAGGGVAEVCRAARFANLTVVGIPEDGDEELSGDALVHELVLTSGRPVLVVPDPPPDGLGRRVVVAWNGTREASRAVEDALPVLRMAEAVTVLSVLPRAADGGDGAGELCRHLVRNHVRAVARTVHSSDSEAGGVLLAECAGAGADLLVMGAYGRSRLREVVLGGATRHVLRQARLPVLMAH